MTEETHTITEKDILKEVNTIKTNIDFTNRAINQVDGNVDIIKSMFNLANSNGSEASTLLKNQYYKNLAEYQRQLANAYEQLYELNKINEVGANANYKNLSAIDLIFYLENEHEQEKIWGDPSNTERLKALELILDGIEETYGVWQI